MNNGILIIAHEPLASALRKCVAHVFPDRVQSVLAQDVKADASPQESLLAARKALAQFSGGPLLVLTEVVGATPCNVARQLVEGLQARIIAGVNVPMLLRAITYQQEPLAELAARALEGGTQGVLQVV
jgi:PTS system ascorbate-specific IIA component